jgi:hypothetical protein
MGDVCSPGWGRVLLGGSDEWVVEMEWEVAGG